MAAVYIAILLGVVAAVGIFTTVWSLVPAAPTNADLVEGRLRVYETGLPVTMTEIELREPFSERIVKPTLRRLGHLLEQTVPERARQQIQLTLQLAGRPGGMAAGDFIAVRYVLTALLCVLAIAIGLLTDNRILLAVLTVIGALIGLYVPMFWLRRRVKARRNQIQLDLPDVIDVLVVCVEAGLTFEAAIEQAVEKYEHALSDEFGRMMQEIRLGRPRLEALNDLGQRCGVDELNNFVQAVIQSEQLGSGVTRILRVQADEIRQRRMMAAQERGARASLKMLLPMLGCIFPTLWVILLGPAAIMALHFLKGG